MPRAISNFSRYVLQAISYTAFIAVVWYFSAAPAFRHIETDQAFVVVAFKHAGQTLTKCRQITPEEMEKLPPNMRNPTVCPRGRSPIFLQVLMDGEVLFSKVEKAPGVFADGSVSIYHSARVPIGKYKFELGLNDSVRVKGFTYTHTEQRVLSSAQVMVINFTPRKGFYFD